MGEHRTDRLSEYLDGTLSEREAARVEDHLAECPACAGTLAELRQVVEAARALPDEAPVPDLWPAIEARLPARTADGVTPRVVPIGRGSDRARRRVTLSVPQLLAAGIALAVMSAGGAWVALHGGPADPATSAPVAATAPPAAGSVVLTAGWETAVAELELEFEGRRGELDAETILVVERNLAIIDQAIEQARLALEADPSSGFLNGYVAEAMRRKVDLLRQATRIHRTET